MGFDFATVGAIVVICYLIGEVAKHSSLDNKWIPVVCGVSGLILGIVGMYVMNDFPVNDILSAMAVGIVSGLGATGVNQVYKQLKSGVNNGD